MALFLCDNKDHHGSDMAITPRTIQPACRIGHTAVRLGGLAAVVKDAQSRTEVRFALSGSGGVSCFDGRPFWDLVQGLGQELDPWTAVMICDGVVAVSPTKLRESRPPAEQRWSKRKSPCALSIYRHVRVALLRCFSRDVFMLQSCTGRHHPTCCKDKDSYPIIRLEKRVAMKHSFLRVMCSLVARASCHADGRV